MVLNLEPEYYHIRMNHYIDAKFPGSGYLMLGSVDAYGHLIVSKLDTAGKGIFSSFICIMPLMFLVSKICTNKFTNIYLMLEKLQESYIYSI